MTLFYSLKTQKFSTVDYVFILVKWGTLSSFRSFFKGLFTICNCNCDFFLPLQMVVADQPWRGGKNLLFDKIFAKNCIKLKEIGQRGGTSLVPSWIRQSIGCVGFNVNVPMVRLPQQHEIQCSPLVVRNKSQKQLHHVNNPKDGSKKFPTRSTIVTMNKLKTLRGTR